MPDTIPGLLAAAAERDPDGTWLRTDSGTLTFGCAAGAVARTADALRAAGIRPGDLVVLTARGTPLYLLSWLALCSIGAVAVATNPAGSPAELAGLLAQTAPRALVTDPSPAAPAEAGGAATPAAAGPARPAGPTGVDEPGVAGPAEAPAVAERAGVPVLDVAALVGDWTAAAPGEPPDPGAVRPDDVATLIPTSGTTGRSKLVTQTHRTYAMAGEGFPYWMELSAADRLLTTLPLFHINAPAYSVCGSLACGAGLVLLPRFSASRFWDAARRHGATEFNAIGAMLEILMLQPERPDDADNPVRLCYTGPSPARERQQQIERRFGLRIVCGYALSESPYGLIWPHGTRPFGTLGRPRQHPRLGVVNRARAVTEDGGEARPGETGELQLSNPTVTPGYWGMPEETARAIADGWLRTGDLVRVEADGGYTFVSRIKEVIRRRGENLSPAEVEEVLAAHPAVAECAVVGVPSALTEEEVKAFLVAAPGATLDFAELRGWAAQRLAAFKVPRYWQALPDLPRTPTARVAKHRLPAGHPPEEYDAEQGTERPGAPGRGSPARR